MHNSLKLYRNNKMKLARHKKDKKRRTTGELKKWKKKEKGNRRGKMS